MKSKNFDILSGRQTLFPGGVKTKQGIEQVRQLIRNQKKVKGFTLASDQGNNKKRLNISGEARIMLGIAVIVPSVDAITNYPTGVRFEVNNEVLIQDMNSFFFSPAFMDDEFYYFPRPLSGADEVIIEYNSPVQQDVFIAFYYI